MVRRLATAIERLVGAEVQPGERSLVALFFLNLLLLLTAYYVLKVVREPLILLNGGAVSRSYARGLQALLLVVLVPAYSLCANGLDPARLVKWVNVFFITCLAAFLALLAAGVHVGFAFFVWLGIFSTMAIAQFWSLANDLLTESEGKRLFPMIAVGGTIGGIIGSQIAAHTMVRVGAYGLMVLAAVLLCGCVLLTEAGRRATVRHRRRIPRDDRPFPRDDRGGFSLLIGERYLLLIGASILLLNLINTTGDFILAEMVSEHARAAAQGLPNMELAQQAMIGRFYGNFQTAVTVMTAFIQIVLVARIFRTVGVRPSLLFLPLLVTAGYGVSAIAPAFALIGVVKITENSTDYSLQNTVQQALFLPTSRDVKYKAKAAIDTFIVRAGDLGSTALVVIGVSAGLGPRGFAWANVALGLMWLVISWKIGARYSRISSAVSPVDRAA